MSSHIVEEAKRCLQCKVPKCREGCPVQTPVNEFIRAFLEEDILSAGAMLFENNPLSVVCSLVCPQEFQCEGHCVLGKKAGPVHISDIEHYISSYYLSHIEGRRLAGNGHKVAIIGSGPAGITVAFLLAQRGFEITIYEAHDLIGGVMRYGIPGFRLPKDLLEKLKDKLVDMGVKIRPNTLIGPTLTLDDLFRDGFKAVFIGTGVWKPRKLDVKGESLGHVHYAIDYLKNPEVYTLGRRVIVIGAGNTAMDVARTALRKSLCRVTVVHIGDPGTMSALPEELEMAKMDGVKFIYNRSTVEILDEGIKVRRTQRGGPGGSQVDDPRRHRGDPGGRYRHHRHQSGPKGCHRFHHPGHRTESPRACFHRRVRAHDPPGRLRFGGRGPRCADRGPGREGVQAGGEGHRGIRAGALIGRAGLFRTRGAGSFCGIMLNHSADSHDCLPSCFNH